MELTNPMSNIGGSLIGGIASLIGGREANAANAQLSRDQMDFQQRMSNTAHRREVADLRAAGLNPILSATKGQGATTPTGAQAKMENVIAPAVTTALDGLRMRTEAATAASQIGLQQAQGAAAVASAKRDAATAKQTEVSTQALSSQLEAIRKKAGYESKQYDWDTQFQKFDNYLKRVTGGLEAGATAKDMLSPLGGLMRNMGRPQIKLPNSKDSKFEKHGNDLYRKSDGLIIND